MCGEGTARIDAFGMRLDREAREGGGAFLKARKRRLVEIAPDAERYGALRAEMAGDAFSREGSGAIEAEGLREMRDGVIDGGGRVGETTVLQERRKVADDIAPGARFRQHAAFRIEDASADAWLAHAPRGLVREVRLERGDIDDLYAVQLHGQFGETEREECGEREDRPGGDLHRAVSPFMSIPMRRRASRISASMNGARTAAAASAPRRGRGERAVPPHSAIQNW